MRYDDVNTVTDPASPEPVQPIDATKRKSKMTTTAKKAKTAPKARKAVKAKTNERRAKKTVTKGKAKARNGLNALGHREGSRKSKAHDIFNKVGDNDKARAQVLKLGVKETTVSSWFSTFRNV
jgi:hypothetical protein